MRSVLLATAATLFLAAPAFAQMQPVTLKFAAEVGGKPFACGTKYSGIGTTKSTVALADFRLYVSEVQLVKADGTTVPLDLEQDGKWQYKTVALLDFENGKADCANGTPETHTVITGKAPKGKYTGVKLTIGVPFDLNHKDATLAPSPLNLTSMFWTWQGGYKFIKLDMATNGLPLAAADSGAGHAAPAAPAAAAAPKPSGFSLHLGSTMCQAESKTSAPSSCANSNRMALSFDGFNPKKSVLVIDPAAVLAGTNVDMNTPETSPGCMSFPKDPDCVSIMPKLGLAYGDAKPEAQMLLHKR